MMFDSRLVKYSILFFLCIIFVSCEDDTIKEYNHELILFDEYVLPIDSVTSVITTSSEAFVPSYTSDYLDSGNVYLALINRGSIQFYDYSKKRLVHTLKFKFEGPNSVSSSVWSFDIINQDSIILSSFPSPYFYIGNIREDILDSYEVKHEPKIMEAATSSGNPILLVNGNFYLGFYTEVPPLNGQSPLGDFDVNGIVLEKNKESKNQKLRAYLTEPYLGNKLYSQYYYLTYLNYTPDKNSLMISLGADDSLTVTNFKDTYKRYYAGSDLFDQDDISGYTAKMKNWDHYRLNYMYEGIIYDKYRKCYYRFVSLPKKEEDLSSPDLKTGRVKDFSIVVLNDRFEKIAETLIPTEYCDMSYFITEQGLHLYNIRQATIDEDNIYYGIFKLNENTN